MNVHGDEDVEMKELDKALIDRLIAEAMNAREKAYAPYSGFMVGAALLTDDNEIITGCNIENASFGTTNCAERTAVFKAVSEGKRAFRAIAVIGSKDGEEAQDYTYPCGICRQVLLEFGNSDFVVIAARTRKDYRCITLSELVPYGFRL